jgi:hypothetical protein
VNAERGSEKGPERHRNVQLNDIRCPGAGKWVSTLLPSGRHGFHGLAKDVLADVMQSLRSSNSVAGEALANQERRIMDILDW